MKTSKRLSQIDQMITAFYQDIWDCCCDHGFLGMSLIKRQAADTIHFVDINAAIIAQLEAQLLQGFPQNEEGYRQSRWRVYCEDVARLPLCTAQDNQAQSEAIPLIIIAGVGGDLLIELVEKILQANPHRALEFILCPVHHNYKVRQALKAFDLGLINEVLVKENRRFYEILHVTTATSSKQAFTAVSPVGDKMWDFSLAEHQQYLQQTISHYQRMQKNPHQEVSHIIRDYQALLGELTR